MSRSFPNARPRRRALPHLLTALALSVTTLAVTGAVAPSSAAAPDGTLRLAPAQDGTASGDFALNPRLEPAAGKTKKTDPLRTSGFSMVGVTWPQGSGEPTIRVRTKETGESWGSWLKLEEQHDVPAAGEDAGRAGTQPTWTGRSDQIQVEVAGAVPKGAELSLIDPDSRTSDRQIAPPAQPQARTLARKKSAPAPTVYRRGQWGANESWKNGSWTRLPKPLKQIQVHHTAGSNSYGKGDVPGILRGIYRYHTQSLGWFDLGYNFLVDKWGRAWVGRVHSYDRYTKGAHTLGFNHNSIGIAVIGNYQSKAVPRAVITKIVRLSAWKLDWVNRKATGKVSVWSTGADKYRKGGPYRLPAMLGHRTTNDTACPGAKLYNRLPAIRKWTQNRINRFG